MEYLSVESPFKSKFNNIDYNKSSDIETIKINYLREFINQFKNISKEYNIINIEEVIRFVLVNDDLIELIQKVTPLLKQYFPEHKYCLKFVPDPEFKNLNQLVAYIEIEDNDFDKEWDIMQELEKSIRASCSNLKVKHLFSVDLW